MRGNPRTSTLLRTDARSVRSNDRRAYLVVGAAEFRTMNSVIQQGALASVCELIWEKVAMSPTAGATIYRRENSRETLRRSSFSIFLTGMRVLSHGGICVLV